MDAGGRLASACTSSGMAWKLHGRAGDSPTIGAGLFVHDEVGAATSTGVGEEVIPNAGRFLVMELMRQSHRSTPAGGRRPRSEEAHPAATKQMVTGEGIHLHALRRPESRPLPRPPYQTTYT